jgi:hypothetical protein
MSTGQAAITATTITRTTPMQRKQEHHMAEHRCSSETMIFTTPHGGTPVQLGDHGFHLELVPDSVDGKLLAYVLDAHMEKEVSVSGASFELIAKVGGAGAQEHRLTFNPVGAAPNAREEKTSVFTATATNLNTLTNFEGVIPKITLDGKTFESVKFSYPKGSRHEH